MSSAPAGLIRRRLLVSGRVQMVGFRAHAARMAVELELAGWVRNRGDGRLEAVAQGSPAAVEAFEQFLRQGPPAARVERVEVLEEEPDRRLPPFSIDL